LPVFVVLHQFDIAPQILVFGYHSLGAPQHCLAKRREIDLLRGSIEQRNAKFLLQALDAAAERRLTQAHRSRCAAKVRHFSQGDKIL